MDAKKIGSFIAENRKAKKMTQMQMGENLKSGMKKTQKGVGIV